MKLHSIEVYLEGVVEAQERGEGIEAMVGDLGRGIAGAVVEQGADVAAGGDALDPEQGPAAREVLGVLQAALDGRAGRI